MSNLSGRLNFEVGSRPYLLTPLIRMVNFEQTMSSKGYVMSNWNEVWLEWSLTNIIQGYSIPASNI